MGGRDGGMRKMEKEERGGKGKESVRQVKVWRGEGSEKKMEKGREEI